MLKELFTIPLSWLYGLVIAIRHKLFGMKILKSVEFDIPIVCVGNITVGGTGKTPHTEYLVKILSPHYKVAVLSRGYKRRSKGFREVLATSTCREVGDEPKQIKLKFPNTPVVVCEKRVDGINILRKNHPDVNLIILDDAFQHRYVEAWVNVVLMDYTHPVYEDHLLPRGRLRDRIEELARAQFIIVTKCPEDVKPIDMRVVSKALNLYPYQTLYFTRSVPMTPRPIFPATNPIKLQPGQDAVVMAAIADPTVLIRQTEERFNVIDKLIFPDHHAYKTRDLKAMFDAVSKGNENTIIIVTEKDAVKLSGSSKIPKDLKRRLFCVPITIQFVDNFRQNTPEIFLEQFLPYVRKNQKYSILNPS